MTDLQVGVGGDTCVACGAQVAPDARFCHSCGAPLRTTCPTCGSELQPGAAFCSSCGTELAATPPRIDEASGQEERRVVTVVFADLAGSTALGERIDPEDMRALLSDLFDLVNTQVALHGGITEKFIGDAILAVFGVPQAHEDDAERAVRAALGIRNVFAGFAARVERDYGADVGIRIGVNTGDVIASREAAAGGELIVTGDAVNVAARLQQLAEPGDVLVGGRTQRATQRVIAFEERGELEAKGKALPLRAWRALDAFRPQRARGLDYAAPLIGRDDELALLLLAASRVERQRSPQLLTVFGPAGVGKSRLVSEFADQVDARVLVGRCVPYGDGVTYLPLAEVAMARARILEDDPGVVALEKLRSSVADDVPADQVDAVVEVMAWTLGLGLPGHSAGIGLGGDVRQALHEVWARYLGALGRRGLVVLVVEDIHWASEALLDLLEEAIDSLEDAAVLVVCPSRPELLDARPSWGTGRLNASSLTLAPLSSADAEHLLAALLRAETVPDQVLQRILEPAEGNPFFVEEMLAMLVEQGAIEEHDGSWVATDRLALTSVPDSIHGVIAARLDLLDARDREALRRCSVMGRVFWPSAVGVDDRVVAALGRRGLVSEQAESAFSDRREFAFKHALTHEVAYATLPRYERGALHRRVAEWLSTVAPDREAETTELVAFHYEQALRWGGDDEELRRRALEATLSAGDAADRRGAYRSAERLLERALELASIDRERATALLMAARVDTRTSQYDRARERLGEVIAIADETAEPALRGDALGLRARASWLGGRWREALESAEAAVDTFAGLPESAELARALSRLSQIQMLRSLPEGEETATRAIEVAVRTHERAAEANARINLFTVEAARGVVPKPDDISSIIALAAAGGAHDEATRAVVNFLWSGALLGSLEPVERFVNEMLTGHLARGINTEVFAEYLPLSLAVLVYVPAGRWEEADAVGSHEAVFPTTRLVWLWLVGGQALRRGELELADRYLSELRRTALATEEPQRIIPMATVVMPRAVLAGDAATIRELTDVVLELDVQTFSSSAAMASIPRSVAAIGDRERLEALASAFDHWSSGMPAVITLIARGLLARMEGRAQEAAGMLASAVDDVRAKGRTYDAACLELELAQALDESGDEAGADAARARAAAVLDPLGCVNPY
jgi:class 3 adenylate cyclase/tetratricopeptide (TPR) repeat protein